MTVKVVELTLPSAVITAGTFTVNYPAGTSRGTFLKGKDHKMIANQTLFSAPEDFTIAFGSSSATITYNGVTTLAAGSFVAVQLDVGGEEVGGIVYQRLSGTKVHDMKTLLVDLGSPITADPDGFFVSQDLTALGVASVSVTVAAAIAAAALGGINDIARNVVAAWTGAAIITITGTDQYGNAIVEKSASGTSLTGKKAFKTVTGIAVSANVTGLTVGTGDVIGSPVYVGDVRNVLAEIVEGVAVPRIGDYVRIPFQITEAEADAGGSFRIVPGFAGSVVDGALIVENTVTTGGTLTVEIADVAVGGFGLVVADGATAGTLSTDSAVTGDGTEVFTAAQGLELVIPAAFNASAPINGWIGVKRTTPLESTFTAGLAVGTKSTATTADVRGTIDPVLACNGSRQFGFIVLTEDPSFLGNTQYDG